MYFPDLCYLSSESVEPAALDVKRYASDDQTESFRPDEDESPVGLNGRRRVRRQDRSLASRDQYNLLDINSHIFFDRVLISGRRIARLYRRSSSPTETRKNRENDS